MNFNIPEFTVSEFSRSIKRVVEDAFGYVRIKGEITGFKRASSGHIYFNLKDENSVLSAVFFRSMAQLTNFEIGDGLQICASGRITTFEGRSNYQIIVEKVEIAGIGAILEMIEKRRQKLLAEGLFDEIHKKQIPFLPKIIGVITSETGAVIEDIKHRIEARCPTHIMLYPSSVQGEKAAMEVINGIRFFNQLIDKKRPDVIIIARGGGSFEDLLPFSDENLVREVFKSEIPIISAIGHETDTTLIDYVADLRAPTPTAAAELATPTISELKNQLTFLKNRLDFLSHDFLSQKLQNLKNLQRYIIDPAAMLERINAGFFLVEKKFNFARDNFFAKRAEKLAILRISNQLLLEKINFFTQKIDFASNQLQNGSAAFFKNAENDLVNFSKMLKANHYNQILQRGFALIKNEKGDLISSIENAKIGEELLLELADGQITTQVLNVKNS